MLTPINFVLVQVMSAPTDSSARNEDLVWETVSTAQGKTFHVGRLAEGESTTPDTPALASSLKFSVPVNWPADEHGKPDEWKRTPEDFAALTHITRYNLFRKNGGILDYMLQFTCTEPGTYVFRVEAGDVYKVQTWRQGDHYVSFNSDTPTIVNVSDE